jgi:Heat shock protein
MDVVKYLIACVFCLSIVFTAAGCAGNKPLAQKDLMHRRFVLVSVDGKPFTTPMRQPDIEFGENFLVYGGMCNHYRGHGKLAGNVLTVDRLASTRMLCPDDELNKLEMLFGQMLAAGADISFDGKTLTLKQGGRTLLFTVSDWI